MAPKKNDLINLDISDVWGDILKSKQHILAGGDAALYEEVPVDIETFVKEFLGITPQRGAIDTTLVAPSVLSEPQKEFIEKATDFDNKITNFILWVGKGGGKNTVSCMTFCYAVYKLLCMRDPHGYLGHSPLKPMTLLNVGGNAIQGKKNFFDPLKDMLRAPKFLEWLVTKGFKPERDILNNEIVMPKGIQLYSGHTGTAGKTSMPVV